MCSHQKMDRGDGAQRQSVWLGHILLLMPDKHLPGNPCTVTSAFLLHQQVYARPNLVPTPFSTFVMKDAAELHCTGG